MKTGLGKGAVPRLYMRHEGRRFKGGFHGRCFVLRGTFSVVTRNGCRPIDNVGGLIGRCARSACGVSHCCECFCFCFSGLRSAARFRGVERLIRGVCAGRCLGQVAIG